MLCYEVVSRLRLFPALTEQLAALPPKLVDIGGGGAPMAAGDAAGWAADAAARVGRMRAALCDEAQTTFVQGGDRELVVRLLGEFVAQVGRAWRVLLGTS